MWIHRPWGRCAVFFAALGILALTRFPFAPPYLFFHDTVNFALSIREFNPSLHQPQPPGYPLFVALLKLIHAGVPSAETTLLLAGIIGAALAVYFLWMLGDSMFGPPAGVAAAVLLLFHPLVWFSGLTNPVRLFLAVCQAGTALMAWRSWERRTTSLDALRSLLWLALTLGVLSGFRPVMLLLMSPLFLAALLRHRALGRRLILPPLLLTLVVSGWITALLAASGGIDAYLRLIEGYSHEQFGGSSLLLEPPRLPPGKWRKTRLFGTGSPWPPGFGPSLWPVGGSALSFRGACCFSCSPLSPRFSFPYSFMSPIPIRR